MKDAKGNFILWPRKDIILKTRSSLIILLQNREDEGTLTSQNTLHNTAGFTPPQNPPQATLLMKIYHLHNLLSIILHHVLLFQSLLLTLPLLFKIHHLHILLSIILYYVTLLLTPPLLLKIYQLNKLFNIVLHHVLLFQTLLLTLPFLFKIDHLYNFLSIILYYASLLLTLPLLKIHQ
jgi:hypothetical protein